MVSGNDSAYAISFDGPLPSDAPPLAGVPAGSSLLADRRVWDVASVTRAELIEAQWELPAPPRVLGEFSAFNLRVNADAVPTSRRQMGGPELVDRPQRGVRNRPGAGRVVQRHRCSGRRSVAQLGRQGLADGDQRKDDVETAATAGHVLGVD